MSFHSQLDGLSKAEADDLADEWQQLGAKNIRRTATGGGKFRMEADFPGSPFATDNLAEVLQPAPQAVAPLPLTVSTDTAFAPLADEYRAFFDACVPDPTQEARIQAHLKRMRAGTLRYRGLGQQLGIPWQFIAVIHSLECGCDFKLHLHNGDPLTARTVQVPAGRPLTGQPPFTWETSAEDALRMKGYVGLTDWSLASMLFRWEQYNGMGYRLRGLASPYLWSFSNLYTGGLFVADHVFDSDAKSQQCGAAVLLKRLQSQPLA